MLAASSTIMIEANTVMGAVINGCPLLSFYDMAHQMLITSSPEIMGGTPVFTGTRVPVQTLIEYLEGGHTVDDFLEGFPSVKREQVFEFLEQARDVMLREVA